MTDDEPVVGARYQLGEVLGRGGMAEVHRGVDLRLGRPVAIKRLSSQLAADPTFQERFRREAQAAASLNHPSIAAVYDSGEESDPTTGISIPYIVMELVDGSTLRDVLRREGKLAPARALELTRGVLEALEHSHATGLIHRDIKPANVMLTPGGGIKVMDFGIARAATETSSSLTQTAAVIGTAQYLSPEQARGESVDLRSDIYSAGCVLYELLLGRPPFVGESSVSVAYQHVREPAVPPSELDPDIGVDIDAITLKALAKDRADRYQSAAEMAADITRVLDGDRVTAPLPAAVAAAIPTTVRPRPVPVDPTATAIVPVVPVAPVAVAVAEPEPERRRSAGRTVLISFLAFLLLAGVGYGIFRWASTNDAAASVSVPDVQGATRDEADRELRAAGISPRFVDVEGGADDTVGTVISQDPPGGTTVAAGATVVLEVNVGPMDVKIPKGLVGDQVDDAERKLDKAGFTRVRTEEADDPPEDAREGEVVSVDPKEGTEAASGQQITLRYVADASERPTAPERPTTSSTSEPGSSPPPTDTEEPAQQSDEPTDDPTTDEPTATEEPEESAEPTRSSAPSSPKVTKSPKPTNSSKPTKSATASTSAQAEESPGAAGEARAERSPRP